METNYIKKKNLFKFFKSEDFNEARMKLCALYVLLSYANELHEDVRHLLQGYEVRISKSVAETIAEFNKPYQFNRP